MTIASREYVTASVDEITDTFNGAERVGPSTVPNESAQATWRYPDPSASSRADGSQQRRSPRDPRIRSSPT